MFHITLRHSYRLRIFKSGRFFSLLFLFYFENYSASKEKKSGKKAEDKVFFSVCIFFQLLLFRAALVAIAGIFSLAF